MVSQMKISSIFLLVVQVAVYHTDIASCNLKSIGKVNKVGNLNMSPIGVGTWSWGNRLLWQYKTEDDIELKRTYEYCLQQGVNWFDTADSYGTGSLNGRSEELLGKFSLETKNKRIKPYYCTKLAPYPWRIGQQSMIKAAGESIDRLKRPLDMLQLHWPPSLQWQESEYLKSFATLVDSKQATQIGLSNFGPKGLSRVYNSLQGYGHVPYSNQVSIHL